MVSKKQTKSKKKKSGIVRVPKAVSSSKRSFSIEEERLFYMAMSRINLGDSLGDYSSEESRTVSVQAQEIMKMYGNSSHRYSQLRETCQGLNSKSGLFLYTAENSWKFYSVFSSFIYEDGKLDIIFNKDVIPQLQLMKLGYSKMILGDVFKVRSQYSVRILELMLELRNNKHMLNEVRLVKAFTVDELRAYFGLDKTQKYKRAYDFLNRCIKSPVDEINKKTGYKLSYREQRKGRYLEGIEFELVIPDAKMAELEEKEEPKREMNLFEDVSLSDTINKMVIIGISEKEATKLVKEYGEEYCGQKVELLANTSNVVNPAGWLRRAITDNYEPPKEGNITKDKDDSKWTLAYDYFYNAGFNDAMARVLANAAESNVFNFTENQALKALGVESWVIRESYLAGDFSSLPQKRNDVEIIDAEIVEDKEIKQKLMDAIFKGGPKLSMKDIEKAGQEGINLAAIASSVGKKIDDYIEI